MDIVVAQGQTGAAVEDVQQRLALVGCLDETRVDGVFGEATAEAVRAFCKLNGLEEVSDVTSKVWAVLVDASFELGDRTLFLKMPHFHGHDVAQLQRALGALGFSVGGVDGIFGAGTEAALRKFQVNMGLPSDGIAGAYTYAAIARLHFSWEDKDVVRQDQRLGFARAASVLESTPICLFGTRPFTRSVASRMSNLAQATTPASKMISADTLLVAPDKSMLRVHVVLPEEYAGRAPRVEYDEETLGLRLGAAIRGLTAGMKLVEVQLPGETWEEAGEERSAQHFAITLLDALCSALQ